MQNQHAEGLVFFTDLSGFGRTTKGMEVEQVAELLRSFAEVTNKVVSEAGGTVTDYMLDSALGYFPADQVDEGVHALMRMKHQVEKRLETDGFKMKLRVAGHYGAFMKVFLPPFKDPDLLGETVNIAIRLGSGGQSSHRSRLILSAKAFRKLASDTRKCFHKFTEPIVYLAEE